MNHPEENLQVGCVNWFDYQYPQLRPLLHHSPNGGFRNKCEAARFKAMGVRSGFPDLILLVSNSNYNYLAIELKDKRGMQTVNQKLFQEAIEKSGGKYVVIRDFDTFRKTITNYICDNNENE